MGTRQVDVVIVGGGPAGFAAAAPIAAAGFSTLVVEEHRRVGLPIQCSGLVTSRVLEMVPSGSELIHHEVEGVLVHDPRGRCLHVDGRRPRAYVIDRAGLDQCCQQSAIAAGATVEEGVRATAVERTQRGVRLHLSASKGTTRTIDASLVIGADGVQSNVARWMGLRRPRDLAAAVEWRGAGLQIDPRFVAVFIGTTVAPGFFGWAIPHGQGHGAIGVGSCTSDTPALELLRRLTAQEGGYAGPMTTTFSRQQELCGVIPLDLVAKPYGDNVMTVGDAAGQTKPLSGGGIYTGLVCGRICGQTAVGALGAHDLSADRLKRYAQAVDAGVGKELRAAYRLRKVFRQLNDQQLSDLLETLDDRGLLQMVIAHGDIDFPGNLAARMLRAAPALARFTRPFLRAVLRPTTTLAPA